MLPITASLPEIVNHIQTRAAQRGVEMSDVLAIAETNRSTWTRWKSGTSYPRLRDLQLVLQAVELAEPRSAAGPDREAA